MSFKKLFRSIDPAVLRAEARAIITLAVPVASAQLASMGLFFTDVMMAGHLSPRDLAAIAVGSSVALPFLLFGMGLLMVINPIAAHLHGAGRTQEAGAKLAQTLLVALAWTVPSVVAIRHGEVFMAWMGIEEDVTLLASRYLRAMSNGWVFWFGFCVLRFFNDGLGYVRGYTMVLTASLPLNALGNLVLMYGYLGFPALGAEGTGYSTALVMTVNFTALALLTRWKHGAAAQVQFLARPRFGDIWEVLRLGLPNGLNLCMQASMYALMTIFIGTLGSVAVAAHQIALNIASVTFMISLGISMAVSIRVGHAMGRGDLAAVRLCGGVGVGLVSLTQVVLALGMVLGSSLWVSLYTSDKDVTAMTLMLLIYAALFQMGDGLTTLGNSALRGIKDTRVPMWVSLACYWCVGMPLGWYLGIGQGWGPQGFWVGILVTLSLAAVFMNWRFFTITKTP